MSTADEITADFAPTWREQWLLRPWPDGLYRLGAGTERSMAGHLLDDGEYRPTLWQTLGLQYWPDGTWRIADRLWGSPAYLRD